MSKTGSVSRALTPQSLDAISLAAQTGLSTSLNPRSRSIAAMQKYSTQTTAHHKAPYSPHRCTVCSTTRTQLHLDETTELRSRYPSPAVTSPRTPNNQTSREPETPTPKTRTKLARHVHPSNLFAREKS